MRQFLTTVRQWEQRWVDRWWDKYIAQDNRQWWKQHEAQVYTAAQAIAAQQVFPIAHVDLINQAVHLVMEIEQRKWAGQLFVLPEEPRCVL